MSQRPQTSSYSQWFREAVAILKQAGITQADREAMWIFEFGLNRPRLALHGSPHTVLSQEDGERILALVKRRASREPLQYVLGTQEFCGKEMVVGPDVLIPRPESELVVEEGLKRLRGHARALVVDVGTGSGCLAISLAGELPEGMVLAIDRSLSALHLARRNALRHGVNSRISWVQGDLLTPLLSRHVDGKVTAIVANLPYISRTEWDQLPSDVKDFEPQLALYGGPDGFEVYRRLLLQVPQMLSASGILVMEIGAGQAALVQEEIARHGTLEIVNIRRDGLGIERVVCLRRR